MYHGFYFEHVIMCQKEKEGEQEEGVVRQKKNHWEKRKISIQTLEINHQFFPPSSAIDLDLLFPGDEEHWPLLPSTVSSFGFTSRRFVSVRITQDCLHSK